MEALEYSFMSSVCPLCGFIASNIGSLSEHAFIEHLQELNQNNSSHSRKARRVFGTTESNNYSSNQAAETASNHQQNAILSLPSSSSPNSSNSHSFTKKTEITNEKRMEIHKNHWEKDSFACHMCQQPFSSLKSFLSGRENCRCCGKLICNSCSRSYRMKLNAKAQRDPNKGHFEIVCKKCFESKVTNNQQMTPPQQRNHMQQFIKYREKHLKSSKIETNRLLVRLNKLIQLRLTNNNNSSNLSYQPLGEAQLSGR